MLALFAGTDVALSRRAAILRCCELSKTRSNEWIATDCSELSPEALDAILRTRSLFAGPQVLFLKRVLSAPALHAAFLSAIPHYSEENSSIVLWEPALNLVGLSGSAAEIRDAFRRKGEARSFDRDIVPERTGDKTRNAIYALADAAVVGNVRDSVRTYHALLASRADPFELFWAIARAFRVVALVREGVSRGVSDEHIVVSSGLHPFVVQKTKGMLSLVPEGAEQEGLVALSIMDTKLKRESAQLEYLLLEFLLSLRKSPRVAQG